MDALKHSGTERFALSMPPMHCLLLLLAHITASIRGGLAKMKSYRIVIWVVVDGFYEWQIMNSLYGAYIRNDGTVNGQ